MISGFEKKEDVYQLFMQAPVGVYLLKGADYVIEMANEPILQLWGKGPEVIGKPVLASFPEVEEQGFIALLDQVRATGKPFQTDEIAVWYDYNGKKVQKYVTLLYQPYLENGEMAGIFSIATDVTEKVKAKKQLEESENNLRNTILQSPVAMCILKGPSFIVEVANERMFTLWGRGAHQILHKPIFDGLPEAREQGLEDLLLQVYTTGKSFIANERPVMLPRNGKVETVYINFVYEPYREGDGSIAGIIAVATNVTEQVYARKKVEESEYQFRSLVEEATIATAVFEGEQMVLALANESMLTLWGKDKSIIGKPLLMFLPELADQPFPMLLNNVYNTGITYSTQEALVKLIKGGKLEEVYMDFSYKALHNSDNKITSILVMAVDVTEKVKAKKLLEESEQNLRNIILKAPVAMCIFKGPTYIVEIANKRMFEFWGKQESEVLHKPIFEGLPEVKNQGFEELLKYVYTTGDSFLAKEHAVILPRNSGLETVFVNFLYEPLKEENGSVTGIMAVAVEITEQVLARKKMEESELELQLRVQQRTAELERKNAELEQYAFVSSHDLQEPLRKIKIFSSMIKERDFEKLSDFSKVRFGKIEAAVDRMSTTLKDLLNFASLNNVDQSATVNLNEVLANVLNDLELVIEQKKAKVYSTALPTIKAIPQQMHQLFYNLINNALKFSKQDVEPEIQITAAIAADHETEQHALEKGKTYVALTFKDNGIGFDQQNADRIFALFQRLHGKHEYSGTGIGLSLVKKVVTNHGGQVWAQGKLDEGAEFVVLLPV